MMALEIVSESDYIAYNGLPQVEDAYNHIKGNQLFQDFYDEIQKLAKDFEVEDKVAIRLSHKHWTLRYDELMVEQIAQYEGKQAFITKPWKKDQITFPLSPCSWLHKDGAYIPAEYSSDNAASETYQLLKLKSDFFNKFAEIAAKYGFEDLLVPSVATKDFKDTTKSEDSIYLETNINGQSIITEEINTQVIENTVPTTWILGQYTIKQACVIHCKVWGRGGEHENQHWKETDQAS